jgi:hypothetical protein
MWIGWLVPTVESFFTPKALSLFQNTVWINSSLVIMLQQCPRECGSAGLSRLWEALHLQALPLWPQEGEAQRTAREKKETEPKSSFRMGQRGVAASVL